MPISGLVVTLDREPEARDRALAALTIDPRVTCGEPQGLRLPIVTETDDLESAEDLVEALGRIPGISFVDVVSVHFDDDNEEDEAGDGAS
jgi:nitrate reductase NapAB chaperone NapD